MGINMHILEIKDLIVESKKAGAELVRIYSKKYNKEIALRFTNEQQLATHLTDIEQKQIQQYTEIIERAYNYVSSLYSIENNAKQIERLYTSILRT